MTDRHTLTFVGSHGAIIQEESKNSERRYFYAKHLGKKTNEALNKISFKGNFCTKCLVYVFKLNLFGNNLECYFWCCAVFFPRIKYSS